MYVVGKDRYILTWVDTHIVHGGKKIQKFIPGRYKWDNSGIVGYGYEGFYHLDISQGGLPNIFQLHVGKHLSMFDP